MRIWKALPLVGAALLSLSSCRTAGVRYVYMALDSEGKQPRSRFFTDSMAINCIAVFSAGRPDATLDFIIRQQTSLKNWATSGVTPDQNDGNNDVFAAGEVVPGVGSEEPIAFNIPQTGVTTEVQCLGYCAQNTIPCMAGYTSQGNDTCGPGSECCFNPLAQPNSGQTTNSSPFPVGTYVCEVSLDGELQASAPFHIDYPDPNAAGQRCPTIPEVSGVPCIEWVPPSSICPGVGAGFCCTCDPMMGLWNCAATTPSSNGTPCTCGTPGCP